MALPPIGELTFACAPALKRDLPALARAGERAAALRLLKSALREGRESVRASLAVGGSGLAAARALARLTDELMGALFVFARALEASSGPSSLSVIAVGGYGRGELAPFSDIDLLFLLPGRPAPADERFVAAVLYMLWDLGLKVGHAVRPLEDTLRLAQADMTVRTALLEARLIAGGAGPFAALESRFASEVANDTGAAFVAAKLAERDARHAASGASRYLVEPNVKDGKGGLRDLNTLFWIAKYIYRVRDVSELVEKRVFTPDEYRVFQRAENFLWLVRCHLHFLSLRAEERLSFDLQPEMARRLGYGEHAENRAVERFMTDYFRVAKDVGDLTRILCAVLEESRKKPSPARRLLGPLKRRRTRYPGLVVEAGRVAAESEDVFVRDPVNLLRLFAVADEKGVHVHPAALKAVARALPRIDGALRADPEANRIFLGLLASPRDPERILRWLNESGVLGRFLPEFGRIVARTQFNMYHHYTVDEHLIRAVGNLAAIERGELKSEHPLSSEIIGTIHGRVPLYLAVLLHDVAKGADKDHSEAGEEIARTLAARLGLAPAEIETCAWLVRHHLLMSDIAQRRDIADAKTVRDFVAKVQSPERLKLLLCLTVADIRAVGPNVFNGWKGQLLRDLYYAAEAEMLGSRAGEAREARARHARESLAARLKDWSGSDIAAYLSRHDDPYWLSFDAGTHERHARFMKAADGRGRPLAVAARPDSFRAITEILVYAADRPGLFSRLAGGFAASGASVVNARVFTTKDGMAFDIFWIQDSSGAAFAGEARLARLETNLKLALAGELSPRAQEARRQWRRERAFRVAPRVLFDNAASQDSTLVEVNARDRAGLLCDLTGALFACGLSVHAARIATFGERAVDVFYVRGENGAKLADPARLAGIEKTLLAAIGGA